MAKERKEKQKFETIFLNYNKDKDDFSEETYQFLRDLTDSGKAEKAIAYSKKTVLKKIWLGLLVWTPLTFGLIMFSPYFFRILKTYQGIWSVDQFNRMRTDRNNGINVDVNDKKYKMKKWPFVSIRFIVSFLSWIPLLLSAFLKTNALDSRERILVPIEG